MSETYQTEIPMRAGTRHEIKLMTPCGESVVLLVDQQDSGIFIGAKKSDGFNHRGSVLFTPCLPSEGVYG